MTEAYCFLSITFALQNNCSDIQAVIVNGVEASLNKACPNGKLQRFGSWPCGTSYSVSKNNSLRKFERIQRQQNLSGR